MKSRILTIAIASLMAASTIQAQTTVDSNASNLNIPVEGTSMATVRNAIEVLQLIPGVTINSDQEIYVDGKVGTAIYIGTHKVTSITELYSLQASIIKTVELHTSPGAEYGKDVQAVIIFNLTDSSANGLKLSNELNISINNNAHFNDELHLGYKHQKLDLGAHLSWSEDTDDIHEREFVYYYVNTKLHNAKVIERDAHKRYRTIVGQAYLGYDLSDKHNFNLTYRIETTPYKKGYDTGYDYRYIASDQGVVSFNNPSLTIPIDNQNSLYQSRNQINAEYHGKWGKWSIDLGHNSQWFKNEDLCYEKEVQNGEYIRKSYTTRNYLKSSVPLWKGSLSMGLEYINLSMNVRQGNATDAATTVHTKNGLQTMAEYISLQQKWGKFGATAGLRHEYNRHSYKPYEDDGLLTFLNELKKDNVKYKELSEKYPDWEKSRPGMLLRDGKITTDKNHFYPNITVTYDISDKSILSLTHSRSNHSADAELSRLYIADIATERDKLLHSEHIYDTNLSWWYDWLHLSFTHNYYENPLCVTNDSKNVYNGNSYNGIDASIILAPRFKCWQPLLMFMYSKQWFDIDLANGRSNQNRPRYTIHFNNTITLPHDWIIHVNAEWYTKGDYRNVYYYKNDFVMNMSIQKELANKHWSIALKANNLFHSSYKDITTYNLQESGVSNGVRSRKLTTVTISAKYTL